MIPAFRDVPRDLREWTRWILSIETQGTATISLTGYATAPTGDIEWVRLGRRVTVRVPETITGTSNATTLTMTGIPDQIAPETVKLQSVPLVDNGNTVLGLASITGTTITFLMGSPLSATGFTATGTKSIPAGFQLNYVLDQ